MRSVRIQSLLAMMGVLVVAAGTGAGCRQKRVSHPTPTTRATRATVNSARAWHRPDLGVGLRWPAGWVERRSTDFVLMLQRQGGDGAPWISLDVPTLPFHIPGLIPIGSVRSGYLDDLRKAVGTIRTEDLTPPAIPSAAERLVRSTWTDASGGRQQETALLLVHGDRVYILRGRSTIEDEPVTRGALDEIVGSLAWTIAPTSQPAVRIAPAP